MKSLRLILVAMSLFTSASYAQSKDEKAVAEAVEVLRKAMVDANGSVLKDIAVEEITYGHSSGKVEDKAAFVASIATGVNDFKTIDLSNQTIKVVGDVAWVRHTFIAETADNGKPGTARIYVLLVWVKQNGMWKLLARQAVKMPQ